MSGDAVGATGRRVALAALLLSASVAISRVAGFVREAVLAYQVGVGPETDAYQAAFQIPDLLNYFLAGGALSIAFIPLYTRELERRGEDAAERFLATVLGTMGLAAALGTALLFAWTPQLVALQFPGFDPAQQALTARLTRIVLPAQFFFITGGIVRGALMARGRFGAQAASPVLYNLGIIAGGLGLGGTLGVEGFAWGALLGAVLGPFGAAWIEARGRVRLRVRVALRDRLLAEYAVRAAPLFLGVSLLTVDEWYDRWFGGVLAAGTIATLIYARRLLQVPVALVGQAVATAALPAFTRLHAQGRGAELDRAAGRTLQAGIGMGVVMGAGLAALADPLVQAVYVRGAFSAADAAAVVPVLRIFALGVPGWIGSQIAVRVFYARGDTWRPMLLASAMALGAIPLYVTLGPRFGAGGLAAAGALAMTANALATLVLSRVRHGGPALVPLAGTALRAAAAVAPAAAVGAWLRPGGGGALGAFADLAAAGTAFAVLAAAGVFAVGDAPLREALRRLGGRVGGALRRSLARLRGRG